MDKENVVPGGGDKAEGSTAAAAAAATVPASEQTATPAATATSTTATEAPAAKTAVQDEEEEEDEDEDEEESDWEDLDGMFCIYIFLQDKTRQEITNKQHAHNNRGPGRLLKERCD